MRSFVLATAALAAAGAARAATVDTYAFTESGWALASFDPATGAVSVGALVAGGMLTGAFTGTVGPGGAIALADLSAFSATFGDTAGDQIRQTLLTTSTFFWDPRGGPASLAVGGAAGREQTCLGAGLAFAPGCSMSFAAVYPAGAAGAVLLPTGPFAVSFDLPTVTLVSSVPGGPVPEPSSAALVLTGLAATLALARWTGRLRAPAARA